MICHSRIVASLAILSVPLAGCVAAVVPLAAGGALVNKVRRHHRRAVATTASISPAARPMPADPAQRRAGETYRGSLPAPGAFPETGGAAAAGRETSPTTDRDVVATAPQPLPTDPGRIRVGEVYKGTLPPPDGSAAPGQPVPTVGAPIRDDASAVTSSAAIAKRSWFDVLHYVASHYAPSPADSVLLVAGPTLVPMRWVPCGAKPVALLIDLDAAVTPANAVPAPVAQVVDAVNTLGIAVVYTTRRAGAALDAAKAALHRRDPAATTSAAFFPVAAGHEPHTRAAIGKLYCVLAIAGGQPADFPGGGLTAGVTSPGWFLVGAADATRAGRRQP